MRTRSLQHVTCLALLLASATCGDSTPPGPIGAFVDVTADAGIEADTWATHDYVSVPPCGQSELFSGGVAIADVDGDGFDDVFLPREGIADLYFHNLGDGTFEEISQSVGLGSVTSSNGASFADIDGDGDLDLFVTVLGRHTNLLYINDGAGNFANEATARGLALPPQVPECSLAFSPTFADYDHDGDLDVFVSYWVHDKPNGLSVLFDNDGDGFFTDVTDQRGLELDGVDAFMADFIDIDQDGWEDLLITADFLSSQVYMSDQGTGFTEVSNAINVGTDENGMGHALGDIDGDADLDWFITSIHVEDYCAPFWGCSGNRLYLNEGDGTFQDGTDKYGVREGNWGWGAAMFDYDLDTDVDLGMANGMTVQYPPEPDTTPFEDLPLILWRNNGSGDRMPDVADEVGLADEAGYSRAFVPFDLENDGDLDLFVTNNTEAPQLFRNEGFEERHWLRVQARGVDSNTMGIGAIVDVVARDRRQRRVIGLTSYLGHGPLEAHFGLGGGDVEIEQVTVRFPATDRSVVLQDVEPDQVLVVNEPPS